MSTKLPGRSRRSLCRDDRSCYTARSHTFGHTSTRLARGLVVSATDDPPPSRAPPGMALATMAALTPEERDTGGGSAVLSQEREAAEYISYFCSYSCWITPIATWQAILMPLTKEADGQ